MGIFLLQHIFEIITVLASFLVAYITVQLTISHERKQLINEVRRTVYFEALKVISQLMNNPTLIYEGIFFSRLEDVGLQIEVYADEKIEASFKRLFKEVKEKHESFLQEFYTGDDGEEREYLKQNKFFADTLEKEEIDYKIQNLPDYTTVIDLTQNLKSSIVACLRRG